MDAVAVSWVSPRLKIPLEICRQADVPSTTNLLVSTDVSTHLLTIDPAITDANICSQLNARPTLAAGLLPGGQLLATVCPDGVELWSDLVNGEKVGTWMVQPGQDIVAAQVEEGYIVVAKRGGEVAVLSTKQHQLEHVMWVAHCFRA